MPKRGNVAWSVVSLETLAYSLFKLCPEGTIVHWNIFWEMLNLKINAFVSNLIGLLTCSVCW